MESLAS